MIGIKRIGLLFIGSVVWMVAISQNTTNDQNLFRSTTILRLDITGDFKSIFRDRHDDAEYRECSIRVDGEAKEFELKIRTRGHFRLTMGSCEFPPLQLNFAPKKTPQNSVFAGQDKLKLVLPCRGTQDLVEEYLIYLMYQEVSNFAFRVRMVKINFIDHLGKIAENVIGFILEDDDLMAARVGGEIFKRDGLRGNKMEKESYLTMAVFQYFIGNTDWSIEYRHNIKLIRHQDYPLPIPVPYDFDHSGVVDAPYARPAEALRIRNVSERRYRGYCLDKLTLLDPIFDHFRAKKERLLQLVSEADLGSTNKLRLEAYLNKFYRTIDDGKLTKRDFSYPCLKNGTGNVVIKGLE